MRYGLNPNIDLLGNPLKPKNKRQPISKSQKDAVLMKQKFKCAICKKALGIKIHYDHIKPVHKGGKSTTDNLRAIHPDCHHERHILEKAKEMDDIRKKPKESNPYEFKMPSTKDLFGSGKDVF